MVANVTIKGWRFQWAMIKPLAIPINNPMVKAPATATIMGCPEPIKYAPIAPENAKVDPTDKSIPPVRITNVIPAAMIALIEVCRSTLNMLDPVRNRSLNNDITMIKSNNPKTD
jgi:hypothetical protein